MRENTAYRFVTMTGRYSCAKPKIGMAVDQAQQFAADVTTCSQDNSIDTHDAIPAIFFTASNSAIASPNAAPLDNAFIAGNDSRSVI